VPLQLAYPLLHEAIAQEDDTQASVAACGAEHTVPQPPQWDGSKRVSTHAPLHAVSGAPQLVAHVPLEQT
jgi:hypothetical protein